jgi:hypothetical protein
MVGVFSWADYDYVIAGVEVVVFLQSKPLGVLFQVAL